MNTNVAVVAQKKMDQTIQTVNTEEQTNRASVRKPDVASV